MWLGKKKTEGGGEGGLIISSSPSSHGAVVWRMQMLPLSTNMPGLGMWLRRCISLTVVADDGVFGSLNGQLVGLGPRGDQDVLGLQNNKDPRICRQPEFRGRLQLRTQSEMLCLESDMDLEASGRRNAPAAVTSAGIVEHATIGEASADHIYEKAAISERENGDSTKRAPGTFYHCALPVTSYNSAGKFVSGKESEKEGQLRGGWEGRGWFTVKRLPLTSTVWPSMTLPKPSKKSTSAPASSFL